MCDDISVVGGECDVMCDISVCRKRCVCVR